MEQHAFLPSVTFILTLCTGLCTLRRLITTELPTSGTAAFYRPNCIFSKVTSVTVAISQNNLFIEGDSQENLFIAWGFWNNRVNGINLWIQTYSFIEVKVKDIFQMSNLGHQVNKTMSTWKMIQNCTKSFTLISPLFTMKTQRINDVSTNTDLLHYLGVF